MAYGVASRELLTVWARRIGSDPRESDRYEISENEFMMQEDGVVRLGAKERALFD